MASRFKDNIRQANFITLLTIVNAVSRPGVYADVTFKIHDGRMTDHQEIFFKVRPPEDSHQKRHIMEALHELASWSKETAA